MAPPTMDLPDDGPSENRILERNAPSPRERMYSAAWSPDPQLDMMAPLLGGEDMLRIFLFNKVHSTERHCPACHTRYKRPTSQNTRAEQEQDLSGICSSRCWLQLNGPNGFDRDEWMGVSAETTVIVADPTGQRVTQAFFQQGPSH